MRCVSTYLIFLSRILIYKLKNNVTALNKPLIINIE